MLGEPAKNKFCAVHPEKEAISKSMKKYVRIPIRQEAKARCVPSTISSQYWFVSWVSQLVRQGPTHSERAKFTKWNHFTETSSVKNYSVPPQVQPQPERAGCAVAHERTFCKMLQLGLNNGASPVASRFCVYQGIFAKTQNSDLSRKQEFIVLTRKALRLSSRWNPV